MLDCLCIDIIQYHMSMLNKEITHTYGIKLIYAIRLLYYYQQRNIESQLTCLMTAARVKRPAGMLVTDKQV